MGLDKEVSSLLEKKAIEVAPEGAGFYSNLFVVAKKGGGWRPIINLKRLNEYVAIPHFKMESIASVKDILSPNDYMIKMDLKDAYLSIPIHQDHRKYLRCQWKGEKYQFTSLPFGLASAPMVFTKLLRPVLHTLRQQGIKVLMYLDDLLIMAETIDLVQEHFQTVVTLFHNLGFVISWKKCSPFPMKSLEFLGLLLNSETMTFSLPDDKIRKIQRECRHLMRKRVVSGRHLAHIIGLLTSTIPAIAPAPLHYRSLQRCQVAILSTNSQQYDAVVPLSRSAKKDLTWWVENVHLFNGKAITHPKADLVVESDASLTGWGAFLREENSSTGSLWTLEEAKHHINWLELKAAFLAIQTFSKRREHIHIQIYMDNKAAIAYLNKLGGVGSLSLCELAIEIWEWCVERSITVHAERLPGVLYTRADLASRRWSDSGDWKLCPRIFQKLNAYFGGFSIDLFASYRNHQIQRFYSWKPDPQAIAVDALAQVWGNEVPYAFPPFALVGRCLQKVNQEGLKFLLLIAPIWRAQHWYALLADANGQPNSSFRCPSYSKEPSRPLILD